MNIQYELASGTVISKSIPFEFLVIVKNIDWIEDEHSIRLTKREREFLTGLKIQYDIIKYQKGEQARLVADKIKDAIPVGFREWKYKGLADFCVLKFSNGISINVSSRNFQFVTRKESEKSTQLKLI